MDNLAAMTDDFDALLDASSLSAPHVLAETEPIPAHARRRMAQAVEDRQQKAQYDTGACPHLDGLGDQSLSGQAVSEEAGLNRQLSTARSHFHVHAVYGMANDARPALVTSHVSRTKQYLDYSFGLLACNSSIDLHRWLIRDVERILDASRRCVSDCFRQVLPNVDFGPTDIRKLVFRNLALGGARPLVELSPTFRQQIDVNNSASCRMPCVPPATMQQSNRRGWSDLRAYSHPVMDLNDDRAARAGGLLLGGTALPRLAVARFAPSAYERAPSGLHVPAVIATHQSLRQCTAQATPAAAQAVTPRALARRSRRARLWISIMNGLRVQHADVPMKIHDEGQKALTHTLRTHMTYRVSDPYAIEARFRAGASDETVWIFSRDLLKAGLEAKSGLGDVIVWPETKAEKTRIFIRLASPDGTALLSAAEADIRAFVEATGRLVRYGVEHSYLEPMLASFEARMGDLARHGGHD